MTTDFIPNRPSADSDCSVCRQLRLDSPDDHDFVVAPGDGGGWHAWSAALFRYFQRIGHQASQAVVISQPARNRRYVQAIIGHGIAHAEASSNVYLGGDSSLAADHHALLIELGWSPPTSDAGDPEKYPSNWTLPLIHSDWSYLTQMFMATMLGIFAFSEDLPVVIHVFGCQRPCRDCCWPGEFDDDGNVIKSEREGDEQS